MILGKSKQCRLFLQEISIETSFLNEDIGSFEIQKGLTPVKRIIRVPPLQNSAKIQSEN